MVTLNYGSGPRCQYDKVDGEGGGLREFSHTNFVRSKP